MTSPRDRVWYLEVMDDSFGTCGMETGLWRPNVPLDDLKDLEEA
jgi:hypothetical protein